MGTLWPAPFMLYVWGWISMRRLSSCGSEQNVWKVTGKLDDNPCDTKHRQNTTAGWIGPQAFLFPVLQQWNGVTQKCLRMFWVLCVRGDEGCFKDNSEVQLGIQCFWLHRELMFIWTLLACWVGLTQRISHLVAWSKCNLLCPLSLLYNFWLHCLFAVLFRDRDLLECCF